MQAGATTVSLNVNRNIVINSGVTATLDNQGNALTIGGAISGAGNLVSMGGGSLTLTSQNTYAGTTAITAGSVLLAPPTVSPPAGAVSRYSFNNNANDSVGLNNGTLVNSPTFVAGISGTAVSLNGTNQYVSVPFDSSLALHAYTVSFWVNPSAAFANQGNGNPTFFSTRNNSDTTFDVQMSSTGVHGDIGSGGGWLNTAANANASLPVGTWSMVTYAVSSAGYTIYLDGVQIGSGGVGGTPTLMQPGQVLTLGAQGAGGPPVAGSNYFQGALDEVNIYGSVLSAAQVEALYASALPAVGNVLPVRTPLSIASDATLNLQGVNQTILSLSDFTPGSGGSVTNTVATPVTLTINPASGTTTFSGVISDGGTSSAVSLVKSGAGTQVLAGANTYSGSTTISGGTLQIGNGGATGSLPSSSTIVDNANLIFDTTSNQTQGSNFSVAPITGTGSLTQAGSGSILTLNAVNTYSGTTTVSAGTLRLAASSSNNLPNSASLNVASGATLDLTGLTSGQLVLSTGQNLSGAGTVLGSVAVPSGSSVSPGANRSANNTFGAIGTLALNNLTLSAGAMLNYDLGNSGNGDLLSVGGPLTLPGSGSVAVNLYNNANAGNLGSIGNGTYQVITYGSLGTTFSPSQLMVRSSPLAGGTYTFSQVGNAIDLTISGATGFSSGLASQGYIGGSSSSPPNLDSSVGLNANKTYLNAVNMNGPALTINGVPFVGSGGPNVIGPNYSITGQTNAFGGGGTTNYTGQLATLTNTFDYGGNPGTVTLSSLTPGQTYVLTFYQRSFDAAGQRIQNITTSDGASFQQDVDFGASGQGFLNVFRYTFVAIGASETLTISPQIAADTMHIYGFTTEQVINNSWVSGANWSTAAWLDAATGTSVTPNYVGSNANFTAQAAPTTITLDGPESVGHIQFDGLNPWTLAGSSLLTLQTDPGGISVLSALAGSHTIATPVSLQNNAMKTGLGTLILSNAVTSNGNNISVQNGTLQFGDGASNNGTFDGNIVNNSALTFANPTAQTYAGVVSGTGTLRKSAAGTLTLTGASTLTGPTIVTGGTLRLGDGSANNGSVLSSSITNNANLVFANPAAQSYYGTLSGTGNLTKTGAGTLTLAGGQASYGGTTTISGGTLLLTPVLPTSGLQLQLNAGAGVMTSGGVVTQWTDLSGNGAQRDVGSLGHRRNADCPHVCRRLGGVQRHQRDHGPHGGRHAAQWLYAVCGGCGRQYRRGERRADHPRHEGRQCELSRPLGYAGHRGRHRQQHVAERHVLCRRQHAHDPLGICVNSFRRRESGNPQRGDHLQQHDGQRLRRHRQLRLSRLARRQRDPVRRQHRRSADL